MKIDHINIVVSNLDSAKEYFTNLGFEACTPATVLEGQWFSNVVGLAKAKAKYVVLKLPGCDITLELICYSKPKSNISVYGYSPNDIGIRHIAFQVIDIDSVVERLKRLDMSFNSDVQYVSHLRKKIVYFTGPDGILLELAEYSLHQKDRFKTLTSGESKCWD